MAEPARSALSALERRTPAGRCLALLCAGLLTLAAALTLLPMLWAALSVLKPPAEIFTVPPTLFPRPPLEPGAWAWGNWARAWERVDFPLHFANSLILVGAIWALQVIPSAMAAYALSRLPTRLGRVVGAGFFLTLLVPFQAIVIPLYLAVRHIDLTGALGGLLGAEGARWLSVYLRVVLPAGCSAFAIFVFRSFFDELPRDLIEAARLDGAPERVVFWRIAVPLSVPILAVVSIFTVIATWNDFLWPYLVLGVAGKTEWQPIMVRLCTLEGTVDNSVLLAALVIASGPPMVLFLIFQRRILQGVAMTGLRG